MFNPETPIFPAFSHVQAVWRIDVLALACKAWPSNAYWQQIILMVALVWTINRCFSHPQTLTTQQFESSFCPKLLLAP